MYVNLILGQIRLAWVWCHLRCSIWFELFSCNLYLYICVGLYQFYKGYVVCCFLDYYKTIIAIRLTWVGVGQFNIRFLFTFDHYYFNTPCVTECGVIEDIQAASNYFLVICTFIFVVFTMFTKGMLFVVFLITIKPKGNLTKKINAKSYVSFEMEVNTAL